jgi:hypothetical protein
MPPTFFIFVTLLMAPASFFMQLVMAISIYPACKRKGLSPVKWTIASIVPLIGVIAIVHILAQKDVV